MGANEALIDRPGLIETLKRDEGFRRVAKWDNKQYSYGYGTRAPHAGATITKPQAEVLLCQKLDESTADFLRIFKDHLKKFDPVRAGCFVQLIFNMGPGRPGGPEGLLSFKNTLSLITKNKEVPWGEVASGLKASLWYRQVGDSGDPPGRGKRIVSEVATGTPYRVKS